MALRFPSKGFLLSFLFIFSLSFSSNATHVLGGDLTYTCSGTNTYNLQLRLYRDCNGIALGNTANINLFSPTCGTQSVTLTLLPGYPQDATELCPTSTSACSGVGSYGVHEYVYKSSISFTGCWASASDIRISWSSCCRPYTITNVNNPSTSFFYLYNEIDNSLSPCNNSIDFLNRGPEFLCVNQPAHIYAGGIEFDGDSVIYSLTDCLSDYNTPINYVSPYLGSSPFSTVNGITINSTTGELDFTPSITQVGAICVKAEEYRNGLKINEAVREMNFTILPCSNSQPALSGINGTIDSTGATGSYSMSVCPNTPVNILIASYDKNVNDVILSSTPQNLTITGFGPMGSTIAVNSVSLPDVNIQWTPTAADIGANTFLINIEDDNCPLNGLTTYSYTIYVEDAPDINAGNVTPTCGIGDTVTLNAAFAQSTNLSPTYSWTPSIGLSSNSGQTISAFPTNTTTYQVDVQYGNGCSSSDSVTVFVTNGIDIPTLADTTFCSASPFVLNPNIQNPSALSFLNDTLKSIPDNAPSGIYSYIDVTGVNLPVVTNQGIESVCVNFSHDFSFAAADLDIFLVSPNGNVMELSTDNGGSNNAPYTNTCFTPTATQLISTATPPFTGNYLPEGSFNTMTGESTNGLWKLWVIDDAGGFTHKLIDWSITFKNASPINYTWSPAASLSCTNCPNPTATPTTSTTYSVYGVNSLGCSDSSEITVLVGDTILAPSIMSVNYTTSTMDICWNNNPIADGYEVNIDNTGWIPANGNTCHTITGLVNGQIVDIQIRGLTNCSSIIVLPLQQAITFGNNCLDHGGYLTTTTDTTVILNNIINHVNYGSIVNFSHSGGNLSSDGNPMTAPGFDIPIYVGIPATITGSTATAINGDVGFSGSFVGTTITGDATIQNNGTYQTTFNSGNPVHLWFAPITLDDHTNQLITENVGSANECAHVNVSEQINMVFLNELDTFNFQNTVNGDSCTARIRLKGGLPQWDASNYIIIIHKVGDTMVLATVNTPFVSHNGLLEFTVPEQGDYIINVIDSNYAYRTFTVSMNLCPIICTTPFSTNMNITSNYNGASISCFDATDGSISVNIAGGTPPYHYNWLHDSTLTSNTATNIGAGFYAVQILDAGGCTTIDTISIVPPLPIFGNTISIPDTNDWDVGTLIGNASGGVPPYSYQWDPTLLNIADDTAYNVPQGIYSVTITDANGCTFTEMVSVDSVFNSIKELENVNLFQVAPNPTNGVVNIQLELSEAAIVQFDVLDLRGQVLSVFNEEYTNEKQMLLNLSNYPSGVYLIRLKVNNLFLFRKVVLMD